MPHAGEEWDWATVNGVSEPQDLQEAVFQALGGASMAWEPSPTGVFDSTYAKGIGEKLVDWIEKKYIIRQPPTFPLTTQEKLDLLDEGRHAE
jgi:hypothetical protein